MAITDYLLRHQATNPVSFHMPGHKGSRLFRRLGYDAFLDNIVDIDITEIPGADNLFQTEGIIAETMARYRRLYGSRQTYLLINGSSSGLIASILATTGRGEEMIVARNCHKSIFSGVEMAGVRPVYAYPQIVAPYGISGPVSPEEVERCLREHPRAAAVILPSPNYYGICSDIAAIAEVVHRSGKILIVDQAHGAHLKFLDAQSLAAEDLGADIVICSTHKTLASFTESAVANVMGDRVSLQRMEDALGKMESTSPSYILMASLDVNADILEKHGASLMAEWKACIERFYREAAIRIPGLRIMEHPMLDRTKINLDMSGYGLSGHALEQALTDRGIWPELVTGDIVMCMTGVGNQWSDYEALLQALQDIAATAPDRAGAACTTCANGPLRDPEASAWSFPVLTQKPIPKDKAELPLGDAAGKVCARALIPYPPGIPIVCPGEVLTEEICRYIAELRAQGENVIGLSAEGTVCVGI